jgi:hypothetical protein
MSGSATAARDARERAIRARLALLLTIRVEIGLAAIGAAVLGLTVLNWETALDVSLITIGVFILLQTLALYLWGKTNVGREADDAPAATPRAEGVNVYADAAKFAITTQGVVLGLVAFADPRRLNLTLKVGAASLAVGVLIGSALYLLVAQGPPRDANRGFAAGLVFALLLWLLGFGLVCIVAGTWSAK